MFRSNSQEIETAVDLAVARASSQLRDEVSHLLPVLAEQDGAVTIIVQSLNVTVNVGIADGGGGGGATHCGDASIVFGENGAGTRAGRASR